MFDQECIDTLIEGTDLFGMFRCVITNLQRFEEEHEATPEVWTTGPDYGLYENAVCSAHQCFVITQCHPRPSLPRQIILQTHPFDDAA